MSTSTYAVDYDGKRVFDLGNHSTALLFEDSRTATYTREGLHAARDNRVVTTVHGRTPEIPPLVLENVVDASGKAAVDQCCVWMERLGIEAVDLITENAELPWEGDEDGLTLRPGWAYYTPFRHPCVTPDPYTRRGEVYFRAEVSR